MHDLPIVPAQASNFAVEHDALFFVLTALTVAFSVLVFALVIFLAVRYRRGNKVDRSNPQDHNSILELSWSIGPLVLGLAVFIWSAKLFTTMYGNAPKDAMEIRVIGKQWMWHIQHENGIRENSELHIPSGRPVRLTMISQDVIHSFFIPAFRVKRDVIPGRYTSIWFTPTLPGKYHLFCAEYCGTEHSEMIGSVYVMEPIEFQKWLATGGKNTVDVTVPVMTSVERGRELYEQQNCGSCHDPDGANRGPSLAGLYGTTIRTSKGEQVLANEEYLRHSILEPNDKIADKYQQIMPSYKGVLTEEQMFDLLAYLKSLSPNGKPRSAEGNVVAFAPPAISKVIPGNNQ